MATVAGSKRLLDISGNNISTAVSLTASGTLLDTNGAAGASNQILSSTGSGVDWVNASSVIGGPYLPVNNPTFTGALTGPSATITGNTLLGNSNGDYVHVNDRLFVGATDSGNAEFWFGEGTTGDVNYGAHWHWDSGYTHKWFTVNNSSETLMMSYATNDTSKVNWYRDVDIQDNDILIDSSHGFINSGSWTRNATPHGYIDFGPANTSHAHIYTDRPNFYFNKALTVNGSSIINQNDIRSKIFYDVDNTSYYADFGSGQIVLGGTGRIQGIDTVSASTDAANKAYVDASHPTVNNGTLNMTTSTGLDGGATFTANQSGTSSFAVSLDLSELADMTQTMIGADEFIVLDNGAERRKAANEIGLSIFNNDAGFTTNTGDITAVVAGTGLTGGGTSGDVTLNADYSKLAHIVDSSNGSVTSGWITVAQADAARRAGEIYVTDSESSDHSYIRIEWMRSYADSNFTVLNCGGHANRIQGVRVLEDTSDTTYGKKYLQVKVTATSNYYVIVTAPGTIPNYGDFIAETPVLENTKTGYNIKGNTIEDLHNSSLGSEQGITSGGNIELNDARYVFTKGDVLSLSAGGAGSGTEIVLDDPASVIKLNSDTIARDEFRVSSSTDGTGDDVFIANSGNGTFTLGDIEGLGSEAFIQGDASNIKIRNSSADSLVADSNNNVSIPNGNLIISEQIGVNTTNFNPQAGIIVNGNQTFGTPGGGSNVNARYLSIEGGADGAGEGSGRIFFSEHNSTTTDMDDYGMSLGYRGGPTSIVGASGQTWGGLSQIGNGEWGMWGHNNSASGALIMHGDRAATYVDFSGNNIQGITDAYIADQIIHTGDTNTYMQFHAADQWRVVTGGSERLEVNNTQVTVANNLQVGGSIYASQYIYHTGDTNTFMRFPANDTISWNTAGSERMRINSSGNVGIGTTAPGSDLEIFNTSGSTVISEARISSLVTSGYGGQSNLWLRTSNYGSAMIAFGNQNGASAVANSASGKITYNSYNRIFTVTADSNALLTLGGSTDRVGVNQTNPQYTLDVTGNGRFTSTVTATNFILSSDEKLKENVEKVCGNKVEAEWKTFELKTEKGQKRYGVIAQELEKTNPEFVREDSQGFKSVAYIDLLIAKIAELEARLEKLEK